MVVIPFEFQLDAPLKVRALNGLHHSIPIVWLVFLDVLTFVEVPEVGDNEYFAGTFMMRGNIGTQYFVLWLSWFSAV